jgi:hypothetical protein
VPEETDGNWDKGGGARSRRPAPAVAITAYAMLPLTAVIGKGLCSIARMLQRLGLPPVMPGRLSESAFDALRREWQLAQSHASGVEDRVAQGGRHRNGGQLPGA